MKTILSAFVAVAFLFTAAPAFAAAPPKVVTFPAKEGPVTFDHAKHQKLPGGCKNCHGAKKPEKIKFTDEKGEDAHKLCLGCHTKDKKGPQGGEGKCGECHKGSKK